MTDKLEAYEQDVVERGIPPEVHKAAFKSVEFETPTGDKPMYATTHGSFIEKTDEEVKEDDSVFSDAVKNEGKRKLINAGAYLMSFAAELPFSGIDDDEDVSQETIAASLRRAFNVPDEEDSEYGRNVATGVGLVTDIGSAIGGGALGLKAFQGVRKIAETAKWVTGSASFAAKTGAIVAGETAALNMVSPESQAAYVELANAFDLDETFAKPLVDLGMYAFSHDMDDGKIETFVKQFSGDLLFVKNLEMTINATKHVVKSLKEFGVVQKRMAKVAPKIKNLVSQGSISTEVQAQKLLDSLDAKMIDSPLPESALDSIKAELIAKGKEGKMVQLSAGKKFTSGSAFVTDEGNPVMFLSKGKVKGLMGTHLKRVDSDITKMKPGKKDMSWVNVKEEELLRLDDLGGDSVSSATKIDDLIETISDHPRFDLNTIKSIRDEAAALTDQQLKEIAIFEKLDPKKLEFVRDNYAYERIVDSGGYRAASYSNETGQSIVLLDPEKTASSIYSQRSKSSTTMSMAVGESPTGVRTMTRGESDFAEELMAITKSQETELGIKFETNKRRGIDFKVKNLDSSDRVIDVINKTSADYKGMISEAKRGKITHDMTEIMAKEMNWSVDDIIKRQKGGTFNAEEMLASRHILLASANVMDKLSGKINLGRATDEDRLQFLDQMRSHVLIQAQVKGAQTEIARAMSAMRIKAGITPEDMKKLLDHNNVDDMAKNYAKLPGAAEKNKFAELATRKRWENYLYVYTNSLLSNPMTQAINFVSNVGFQLYKVPESMLETTIATGRRALVGGTDGARFSDAVPTMLAFPQALGRGLILAKNSFVSGVPSDQFSKFDQAIGNKFRAKDFGVDPSSVWGRGIDLVGFGIGLPGRTMLSQDELAKGITYELTKAAETNRRLMKGISEGADDVKLANDFYNGKNGYDDSVNEIASQESHIMTHTQELDGLLDDIQKIRHKYPPIQVILPFYRAPTNIIGSALTRTPVGLLSKKLRNDLLAGGASADKAMAKIGLGSTVMMVAGNAAMEGRLTGGGGNDHALAKHMQSVGRQPYSFAFKKDELSEETIMQISKLGIDVGHSDNEIFISYRKLEPIGSLLAMASDFSDVMKYYNRDHDEDTMEVGAIAGLHAISQLSNNSFLGNFQDLLKAMNEPNDKLVTWLGSLAASHVPAIVGGLEKIDDPALREPDLPRDPTPLERQFYKAIAKVRGKIPGASEELPLGLNLWGHERKYSDGGWTSMFNPAHVAEGKRKPIDLEIESLGHVLSMPTNDVMGVKISGKEYNQLITTLNDIIVSDEQTGITGPMREVMSELVQLDEYKQLIRDDRIETLNAIKNQFVSAAKLQLLDDIDSLQEDVIELKERKNDERLNARELIQ